MANVLKTQPKMHKFERYVFIYVRTFVMFNSMIPHIVNGEGQSLFASLGQLELLWQNDIDVVQTMQSLLKEKIPEYRPIKRYYVLYSKSTKDNPV